MSAHDTKPNSGMFNRETNRRSHYAWSGHSFSHSQATLQRWGPRAAVKTCDDCGELMVMHRTCCSAAADEGADFYFEDLDRVAQFSMVISKGGDR